MASVVSESLRPYGLLPARLLCPWDSPDKNTGVYSLEPCPPPGELPNPGIEPESLMSPALAGGLFTASATWEACMCVYNLIFPQSDRSQTPFCIDKYGLTKRFSTHRRQNKSLYLCLAIHLPHHHQFLPRPGSPLLLLSKTVLHGAAVCPWIMHASGASHGWG